MGLTHEQLETVKKEAEKYMDANEAFGKAAVALWNARISMVIATEDEEAISETLKETMLLTPMWGGDNHSNCHCTKE